MLYPGYDWLPVYILHASSIYLCLYEIGLCTT